MSENRQVQSALQACSSCRKQKRKCDKALPTCSLCQRIGRFCDYTSDQAQAPSPEDFAALRQKVADLESLLASNGSNNSSSNGSNGHTNGSHSYENSPGYPLLSLEAPGETPPWPGPSSFPSLFFLDSDSFDYGRFTVVKPYVRVPPGALAALGSSGELKDMVELYFRTVHLYMPIVSKIRLYQYLASPFLEPGADMALLFLAMKLSTVELPEASPHTPLYRHIKTFYAEVEAQNGFSIQLIQAAILTALYELGHAIYPAAYLTIGHCARLGQAMGLHARISEVPSMLQKSTTWTEQEERRRVWWAIVILDRFVNVGNRGKPFATEDPGLEVHLPTDDDSWDRGVMLVAAPLALSASTTNHAAPFARACQAAHLLGKIVRHLNDKKLPLDFRFDEALQLHRTVRSLASLLPDEAGSDDPTLPKPTLCTSMAICYSALLTLYDGYSCTERAVDNAPETQLVMQKDAIAGLGEISATVMMLAQRVARFIETAGLAKISPLVVDCFYQAAANYAWYVRESSDPACGERLQELKELLRVLNRRWRVAGEYVRIVEATEFHLASAIS